MTYFYEPYLKPLQLDSEVITFKKLSDTTNSDREELAKIYCTLFNQDNKNVIKELGIKGKSSELGIWDERPYTLETCLEVISDYSTVNYFGVCAYGLVNNKLIPVGASVFQVSNLEHLKSKGYELPFNVPPNTEYWSWLEALRIELIANGNSVKGLANDMLDYVIKHYKKDSPVLLRSSTNNPIMVKSWEKGGFVVVNKETTFGNKYQAYKLVM